MRGAWCLLVAIVCAAASRADDDALRPLFNGHDLDGWVAEGVSAHPDGRPVWSVRDGLLACEGKGFGFLRYARESFDDFTFHVEFRMEPGCNTGIGFRTGVFDPARSRATRPSFHSYEIQLVDDSGKPATPHSSGSLYRYLAPATSAMKPAGEWNTLEVACDGPRIRVVLNDQPIHDVDQGTIDALRSKPLRGHVCLQNHGGNVAFRAVGIRTRAPAAPAP
jgi:hypothetical protein